MCSLYNAANIKTEISIGVEGSMYICAHEEIISSRNLAVINFGYKLPSLVRLWAWHNKLLDGVEGQTRPDLARHGPSQAPQYSMPSQVPGRQTSESRNEYGLYQQVVTGCKHTLLLTHQVGERQEIGILLDICNYRTHHSLQSKSSVCQNSSSTWLSI